MWKLLKVLDFTSVGLGRHAWSDSELSSYIIDKINNGLTYEYNVRNTPFNAPEGFIYTTSWPVGTETYTEEYGESQNYLIRTHQYNSFLVEFPELNGVRVGLGYPGSNHLRGPFYDSRLNKFVENLPGGGVEYHYEDRYVDQIPQIDLYDENGQYTFNMIIGGAISDSKNVEKYGLTQTATYNPGNGFSSVFFIIDEDEEKIATVSVATQRYSNGEPLLNWFINRPQLMWDWLSPFIGSETPEEWEPVPQITGNGVTTPLAKIRPDWIRGGQPQTDAPNTRFDLVGIWGETSADLTGLINGMEAGETREKVLYSGANYLNITKDSGDAVAWTATLDFYNAENENIYSWQYNKVLGGSLYLSAIRKSGEEVVHLSCIQSDGSVYSYNQEVCSASDEAALYQWFIGEGEVPNPFEDDTSDGSEPIGGTRFFPQYSDGGTLIDDFEPPAFDGTGIGFFTAYRIVENELVGIAEALWNPTFWMALKDQYRQPAEAIVALYLLPIDSPVGTENTDPLRWYDTDVSTVRLGYTVLTGTKGYKVLRRWYKVDMGTCSITAKWDTYLDYEPYKTITIYLPFIGEETLNVDELMCQCNHNDGEKVDIIGSGCDLKLVYWIDIFTGACVAQLAVNGYIRYQWQGKTSIEVPYSWATRESGLSMLTTAISGAATIAGIALAATPAAPVAAAALAIGAGVATGAKLAEQNASTQLRKGHHNGSFGSLASAMMDFYPSITITYVKPIAGEKQDSFIGRRAPFTGTIGDYSGFASFTSVHLTGCSSATKEDKEEILKILEGGVIV